MHTILPQAFIHEVKLFNLFPWNSCVLWQCIVAAWGISGGSRRDSFPAHTEGTRTEAQAFPAWSSSEFSLQTQSIWRWMARHRSFQGLELFQKESSHSLFVFVALHKRTLQKCIQVQKRKESRWLELAWKMGEYWGVKWVDSIQTLGAGRRLNKILSQNRRDIWAYFNVFSPLIGLMKPFNKYREESRIELDAFVFCISLVDIKSWLYMWAVAEFFFLGYSAI